ncbi:MAG: hypothetical protein H6945_17525 [Zoogloeaceae bacterium]|nr:hypothetical protein [Rhodocyclaceae bacterium]MCP5237538.1 hypothetical protein [Zoogloeaceae bacterium]
MPTRAFIISDANPNNNRVSRASILDDIACARKATTVTADRLKAAVANKTR